MSRRRTALSVLATFAIITRVTIDNLGPISLVSFSVGALLLAHQVLHRSGVRHERDTPPQQQDGTANAMTAMATAVACVTALIALAL